MAIFSRLVKKSCKFSSNIPASQHFAGTWDKSLTKDLSFSWIFQRVSPISVIKQGEEFIPRRIRIVGQKVSLGKLPVASIIVVVIESRSRVSVFPGLPVIVRFLSDKGGNKKTNHYPIFAPPFAKKSDYCRLRLLLKVGFAKYYFPGSSNFPVLASAKHKP